MAETKGKWTDIGVATVWDTKDGKVKRRDKNGKEWAGGMGTITLNGVTHKVYFTVRDGARAGSQTVGLSLVEDEPKTPTT